MPNTYPTLDLPATGAAGQGQVVVSALDKGMTMSISNDDEVFAEGRVYAVIANPDDSENPYWSGDQDHQTPAGNRLPSPEDDPEGGGHERAVNLRVSIPKEVLEEYKGTTVDVGYAAVGEAGMVIYSPTFKLTIE